MIAAALLVMIAPPPPAIGPLWGSIDCLKAGSSDSAIIELNPGFSGEVVLRGLGLAQPAAVTTVDVEPGKVIGRNDKGEPQFQITAVKPGKMDGWWRYIAGGTQGVCYGQLFGAPTEKAHFTSVASIEVK